MKRYITLAHFPLIGLICILTSFFPQTLTAAIGFILLGIGAFIFGMDIYKEKRAVGGATLCFAAAGLAVLFSAWLLMNL